MTSGATQGDCSKRDYDTDRLRDRDSDKEEGIQSCGKFARRHLWIVPLGDGLGAAHAIQHMLPKKRKHWMDFLRGGRCHMATERRRTHELGQQRKRERNLLVDFTPPAGLSAISRFPPTTPSAQKTRAQISWRWAVPIHIYG